MTTRRALILGGLVSLWGVLAAALPARSGPLEATYYYLPG